MKFKPDNDYVKKYLKSHENINMEYKVEYFEYLIINNLFDKPFKALVTACGTFGFSNLLDRAGVLVGVDNSDKMIDAGIELNKNNQKVKFIKEDLRIYPIKYSETFDFIEIGLLGSYLPFDLNIIDNYFKLLDSQGVLLIKSMVSNASDIIGINMNNITTLFSASKRLLKERIPCRNSNIPITVSEANMKINNFVLTHKDAKLIMKNLITRNDNELFNFYFYLKRN